MLATFYASQLTDSQFKEDLPVSRTFFLLLYFTFKKWFVAWTLIISWENLFSLKFGLPSVSNLMLLNWSSFMRILKSNLKKNEVEYNFLKFLFPEYLKN